MSHFIAFPFVLSGPLLCLPSTKKSRKKMRSSVLPEPILKIILIRLLNFVRLIKSRERTHNSSLRKVFRTIFLPHKRGEGGGVHLVDPRPYKMFDFSHHPRKEKNGWIFCQLELGGKKRRIHSLGYNAAINLILVFLVVLWASEMLTTIFLDFLKRGRSFWAGFEWISFETSVDWNSEVEIRKIAF